MSPSSWTAMDDGPPLAACLAWPVTAPASARQGAWSRPPQTSGWGRSPSSPFHPTTGSAPARRWTASWRSWARSCGAMAAGSRRWGVVRDRDAFSPRRGAAYGGSGAPDVDLLIRTGGEQRLSDFLLWESAYAELCFLPRMWPDFGPADLAAAISHFHTRERRFGSLPGALGDHP